MQAYNLHTCPHAHQLQFKATTKHFCGSHFFPSNINRWPSYFPPTKYPRANIHTVSRHQPTKNHHKNSVKYTFSMATSICATGFKWGLGSWSSCIGGEDYALLVKSSVPSSASVRVVQKPLRLQPMMKNVNEGKGLFAPAVVITRNIIGKKRFNQFRGKAIALHSQVITEFCKSIGADPKQRQGLIRLAKKNGERLGFLA